MNFFSILFHQILQMSRLSIGDTLTKFLLFYGYFIPAIYLDLYHVKCMQKKREVKNRNMNSYACELQVQVHLQHLFFVKLLIGLESKWIPDAIGN